MARIYSSLILLWLGAWTAAAATVPRQSLNELTSVSESIVEGRVIRQWTAWDDRHRYIWTHYQVQVEDALKGPRRTVVTVSEPGGIVDGIGQLFSGAVPYSAGEHVMLFLYRTPIGYWRTRGGPLGKIAVENDSSLAGLKAQVRRLVTLEGR